MFCDRSVRWIQLYIKYETKNSKDKCEGTMGGGTINKNVLKKITEYLASELDKDGGTQYGRECECADGNENN